jgi:hypothetical protein
MSDSCGFDFVAITKFSGHNNGGVGVATTASWVLQGRPWTGKGRREFGQKRRLVRQEQLRVKDGGALATSEARGMKVRSTIPGGCGIVSEVPGVYRKATEISPKWISITWPCYRDGYWMLVGNFATDPYPSEILAKSYRNLLKMACQNL